MTDKEIIEKLIDINSRISKVSKRKLATEIDKLLEKPFESTDDFYTGKIERLKRYIAGITNNCSIKYTKRIIIVKQIVDEVVNKIDV